MSDNDTGKKDHTFGSQVVAEGTEYERELSFKLPRGKYSRGVTPRIIKSISGLDLIQDGEEVKVGDVGKAMSDLFDSPGFDDELLPIALGLYDPLTGEVKKEDREWLDMLTDIEVFEAYLPFAAFIASNGRNQEVQAALKKSRGGKGKQA